MEILLFFLLAIVLVLVLNLRSTVLDKMSSLQNKIDALSKELRSYAGREEQLERKKTIIDEIAQAHKTSEIRPEPIKAKIEEKKVEPEKKEEVRKEEIKQQLDEIIAQAVQTQSIAAQSTVNKPPFEAKPGFFERNPDLEKFIG